jgi:glycosyltransferase involved in cell wall biosynthesis
MGNAKVFLLPSVWYENCPLSILEALCMGVPVVTMNSGGMAELVKSGVTGTLVDDPTPEGIALKLKETIENEDYYRRLKENCNKERDNILSVETYSDLLIKEYEKSLGS